jgi:hypothetical protein
VPTFQRDIPRPQTWRRNTLHPTTSTNSVVGKTKGLPVISALVPCNCSELLSLLELSGNCMHLCLNTQVLAFCARGIFRVSCDSHCCLIIWKLKNTQSYNSACYFMWVWNLASNVWKNTDWVGQVPELQWADDIILHAAVLWKEPVRNVCVLRYLNNGTAQISTCHRIKRYLRIKQLIFWS